MQYRIVRVSTDAEGNGQADLPLSVPSSWQAGMVRAVTLVFNPACRPDYEGTIITTLACLASGGAHGLSSPTGDPPAHGADDRQVTLQFYVGKGVRVMVTGGPPLVENALEAYVFIS